MPLAASSHAVAEPAPREQAAPFVPTARLARARLVDAEIRSLHRQRNADAARIAAQLVELKSSRGYLDLGFSSLAAYASARLGWGKRKLVELLRLAERLDRFPLLREAFQKGELEWTKAVVAARAVQNAPESEARWLELAKAHDCRRLERDAAAALGEEPRVRLTLELTPAEGALLFEGLRALESEGFEDRRREAKVAELVRRALQGGSVGGSRFRVLLGHCVGCRQTVQPTSQGDLAVGAQTSERVLCDAEVQDAEGRVSRTVPPKLRNQVLARSNGRCEVPGCTNRAHLELHHNKGWRSGHDPDTLFHLCSAHHAAPHEGRLRIEGTWSTGVRFLLADGTLLGTAGGPAPTAPGPKPADPGADEPISPAPAGGGHEPKGAVPADARESAASTTKAMVPTPATYAPASHDEQRAALKALQRLELPAREARRLLDGVLEDSPDLRGGSAAELVRAALLRIHVPVLGRT